MPNPARERAGFLPRAKVEIGAGFAKNRRARVLRDHEPREVLGVRAPPGDLRLDPEGKLIAPDRAVNGDGAKRRKRQTRAPDGPESALRGIVQAEEDIG